MSLMEWLNQAGHGLFILASYVITFAVLLWNIILPLLQDRRLRQEIRGEIRMRQSGA